MTVRPKKHLGQHFLHDKNIAKKIADTLTGHGNYKKVLEIGAGTGSLTQFLLKKPDIDLSVIDVDIESIDYLKEHYPELKEKIIFADFLKTDLYKLFNEPFAVIGNFPYNISTQILFKVIEHRDLVPEMCGMFQKEVAERIAEKEGNKTYGITSVLVQAFYKVEYLFTVSEGVFIPPPKVKSAVIRLTRNTVDQLDCDEKSFIKVVKTSFNQRRKTIRNSLKSIYTGDTTHPYFEKRPEQLSVAQFIELTKLIQDELSLT